MDELSTYQQFPCIDSHSVRLQLCTEPFCASVFVLSISDASGTLAGKSLTKFRNVLMKLSEIGSETGLNIREMVFPCTAVVEAVGIVSIAECVANLY